MMKIDEEDELARQHQENNIDAEPVMQPPNVANNIRQLTTIMMGLELKRKSSGIMTLTTFKHRKCARD